MLPLSAPSELQIHVGRFPRFLYEAMQKDHTPPPINIEQRTSNSIMFEVSPYLIDPVT